MDTIRPGDLEPNNEDPTSHAGENPVPADAPDPEPGHPKRRTPWNTLSARVISFVSRKGGVGKTTSAVNLGAALALSGHSVLIVGVDPQCGVSRSLGYGQDNLQSGLLDIFTNGTSLTDLALATPLKNLFCICPNIGSLDDEETYIDRMENEVDTFVREIDRARNLYDTILIDCPPSLNSTTRAALLASSSYLVPIQAEELCRDSLERLLTFIQAFRQDVYAETDLGDRAESERPLILEGMFLTMVSNRTRMSRHVIARVTEDYQGHVFRNVIPRTTRLSEMALRGKPAVIYDRRSPGSRAYFDLMDELVTRHHQHLLEQTAPGSQAQPVVPPAGAEPSGDGEAEGLDRMLDDIRTSLADAESQVLGSTAEDGPELVSLDDLLAEEERAAEDPDWEKPRWDGGEGRAGRFN